MSNHVQELRGLAEEFDRVPFANPGDVLADRLRALADRWEREQGEVPAGFMEGAETVELVAVPQGGTDAAASPAPQASVRTVAPSIQKCDGLRHIVKAVGFMTDEDSTVFECSCGKQWEPTPKITHKEFLDFPSPPAALAAAPQASALREAMERARNILLIDPAHQWPDALNILAAALAEAPKPGLRKAEKALLRNLQTIDVQERTVTLAVSTALWENWQEDTRHHPALAVEEPGPPEEGLAIMQGVGHLPGWTECPSCKACWREGEHEIHWWDCKGTKVLAAQE